MKEISVELKIQASVTDPLIGSVAGKIYTETKSMLCSFNALEKFVTGMCT